MAQVQTELVRLEVRSFRKVLASSTLIQGFHKFADLMHLMSHVWQGYKTDVQDRWNQQHFTRAEVSRYAAEEAALLQALPLSKELKTMRSFLAWAGSSSAAHYLPVEIAAYLLASRGGQQSQTAVACSMIAVLRSY